MLVLNFIGKGVQGVDLLDSSMGVAVGHGGDTGCRRRSLCNGCCRGNGHSLSTSGTSRAGGGCRSCGGLGSRVRVGIGVEIFGILRSSACRKSQHGGETGEGHVGMLCITIGAPGGCSVSNSSRNTTLLYRLVRPQMVLRHNRSA